jgi:hypothetical protein
MCKGTHTKILITATFWDDAIFISKPVSQIKIKIAVQSKNSF